MGFCFFGSFGGLGFGLFVGHWVMILFCYNIYNSGIDNIIQNIRQ
jgi:hypothetical protein